MAPESGFSVTTSDGFTVRSDPRGGLNYFLHGERWPAEGEPFEPVTLIESLAKEIERLGGGGVAQAPSGVREALERIAAFNIRPSTGTSVAMLMRDIAKDALSTVSSTDGAAPAPANPAWQAEKERLMQWIVTLLNRIAKLETRALAAIPPRSKDQS